MTESKKSTHGWQGAVSIQSIAGGSQSPQVALDDHGNGIVVWEQAEIQTKRRLWANFYDCEKGWGEAVLIKLPHGGDSFAPQVKMDSKGNSFIVWYQNFNNQNQIWGCQLQKGKGWRKPQVLSDESQDGDSYSPQLTVGNDGIAAAIWILKKENQYSLFTKLYTDKGWGDLQKIPVESKGSLYYPQISRDPNGNMTAIWYQNEDQKYSIWASHSNPDGSWQKPISIQTDQEGDAYSPQMICDQKGNVFVVWRQGKTPFWKIYGVKYSFKKKTWEDACIISSQDDGNFRAPQIDVDSEGNGIAAWYQWSKTSDVWANVYIGGHGWQKAKKIQSDKAGDSRYPQTAVSSNGNAFVVWRQGDGEHWNIQTNRYVRGEGWLESEELVSSEQKSSAYYPQIAVNKNGDAVATWYQWDGANNYIWSNIFKN